MLLNLLSPARLGLAVALTSVAVAAYGVTRRVQASRAQKRSSGKVATRTATAARAGSKSTKKKSTGKKGKRASTQARA